MGLQGIFEASCDQAFNQSLHAGVCTDKLQVDWRPVANNHQTRNHVSKDAALVNEEKVVFVFRLLLPSSLLLEQGVFSVLPIWIKCVCATGYQQANVVILPKHLANDFEAFCNKNPGPLPLLYRSQTGETSCLPLAKDADIRYSHTHTHTAH